MEFAPLSLLSLQRGALACPCYDSGLAGALPGNASDSHVHTHTHTHARTRTHTHTHTHTQHTQHTHTHSTHTQRAHTHTPSKGLHGMQVARVSR